MFFSDADLTNWICAVNEAKNLADLGIKKASAFCQMKPDETIRERNIVTRIQRGARLKGDWAIQEYRGIGQI